MYFLPIVFIWFLSKLTNPIQAPVGEKTTGTGTPAFNKDGAIGSMFKKDGAIGSVGEKVGGPLASDGVVG